MAAGLFTAPPARLAGCAERQALKIAAFLRLVIGLFFAVVYVCFTQEEETVE
ncbi:hypothetical protein GGD50_002938 [Rhizobium paranaense]|uniref:Uncharacterized protein n=1 Tax=Rhizobium paranaense TaxID=1650438 RepID=A0A7W9D1X6_9HYPH|nr:hypothetical protein [Rhizobium paranaense]